MHADRDRDSSDRTDRVSEQGQRREQEQRQWQEPTQAPANLKIATVVCVFGAPMLTTTERHVTTLEHRGRPIGSGVLSARALPTVWKQR